MTQLSELVRRLGGSATESGPAGETVERLEIDCRVLPQGIRPRGGMAVISPDLLEMTG